MGEWSGVDGGGPKSAAKGPLITGYRSHENVHKTNVRVYVLRLLPEYRMEKYTNTLLRIRTSLKLSSLNFITRQVPRERAQLAGSMKFELPWHHVSLSYELMKFSP